MYCVVGNPIKKNLILHLIIILMSRIFIRVPHPMWCWFPLVLHKWLHWISTPTLGWNNSSNLQQFLRNSRNQELDTPVPRSYCRSPLLDVNRALTRKYSGSKMFIFTFSEKRRLHVVHYCLWHQWVVGHFVLLHGFEFTVFTHAFQSVFAQVLIEKE